jgi:hypothetical protein
MFVVFKHLNENYYLNVSNSSWKHECTLYDAIYQRFVLLYFEGP